jgi:hypothetical protein
MTWRRQSFVEAMPTEMPILDPLYDQILEDMEMGTFQTLHAFEKLQAVERHAINSLVRNGERKLVSITCAEEDSKCSERGKVATNDKEDGSNHEEGCQIGCSEQASTEMVSEGGPIFRENEELYYDEA